MHASLLQEMLIVMDSTQAGADRGVRQTETDEIAEARETVIR